MTDTIARRRPALARLVVTFLAAVVAFLVTLAAYALARAAGLQTLAIGIVQIFPLTTAWIAVALTQHLMRKG